MSKSESYLPANNHDINYAEKEVPKPIKSIIKQQMHENSNKKVSFKNIELKDIRKMNKQQHPKAETFHDQ